MFNQFINNVNSIGDHVWALVLVALGVVLVATHNKEVGELIVGGGLALFRGHQQ
jgi:hypothetical protein